MERKYYLIAVEFPLHALDRKIVRFNSSRVRCSMKIHRSVRDELNALAKSLKFSSQ